MSGTQIARARSPDEDGAPPPPLPPGATLSQIYDAYCTFVFVRLRRAGVPKSEARDLHQDVFLHLTELFADEVKPESVAALLARLVAIAVFRRARVLRRFPTPDDGTLAGLLSDEHAGPEMDAYTAEQRRILYEALAKLPEKQAKLIQLVDIAELDQEQVAVALGCNIGTLRVQLHRARLAFAAIAEELATRYLKGDA